MCSPGVWGKHIDAVSVLLLHFFRNAQKRARGVGGWGQAFWSHRCQQRKEVGPSMGRGEAERPQGSPMFMAPGGAAAKGMPPQKFKEMSYLERKLG